jgi:hypothetical protein
VEEKVLRKWSCGFKLLAHSADLIFVGHRFFIYFAVSLGCACCWFATGFSWDGPEDNKPVAELQAMDDPTLAWEAQGVCVNAAITTLAVTTDTIAKRKEALRYLAAILAAKRKKDNKIPPWLYELAAQADRGSASGCNDVAKTVYLPPETPPEEQSQDSQPQEQSAQAPATKKAKK